MNCNKVLKSYRKYKFTMRNNGDDQKPVNLNNCIFLDSWYTVNIVLQHKIVERH